MYIKAFKKNYIYISGHSIYKMKLKYMSIYVFYAINSNAETKGPVKLKSSS